MPPDLIEDAKLPKEFRGIIQNYIHFFPSWARRVYVKYAEDEQNLYMASNGSYQYRELEIKFAPAFLVLNEYERRRTILHEIAHCHHKLIHDAVHKFREIFGNSDQFKIWYHLYEREEETFIEDLAHILDLQLPQEFYNEG